MSTQFHSPWHHFYCSSLLTLRCFLTHPLISAFFFYFLLLLGSARFFDLTVSSPFRLSQPLSFHSEANWLPVLTKARLSYQCQPLLSSTKDNLSSLSVQRRSQPLLINGVLPLLQDHRLSPSSPRLNYKRKISDSIIILHERSTWRYVKQFILHDLANKPFTTI